MLGLKGSAISGSEAAGREAAGEPAAMAGRAQAYALLQTLNARLLASNSATSTLEQWCASPEPAAGPAIHARRIEGADKPVTAEQRERLRVGPEEPVVYRRVELACGERILSEAENWYVPGRLDASVLKALEESDTPFGRAVLGLNPVRETFAVEVFWRPIEDAAEAGLAIPWRLFQHRALVFGPDRMPFSEVNETYTSGNLAFGSSGFGGVR